MPETVQGLRVYVCISGTVIGTDGGRQKVLFVYDKTLSDGAGADQVQRVFHDEELALNNTSQDLDMGAGGLRDSLGTELGYAGLKLVAAQELNGAGNMTLKHGGTNPMALMGGTNPTIPVGPEGLVLIVNPTAGGWTVTDGSADRLAVQTSADSTLQILLAGD